jgi:hypothetical protein
LSIGTYRSTDGDTAVPNDLCFTSASELAAITGGAARTPPPNVAEALQKQVGGPETQFQAGRVTSDGQAQMMGCGPIASIPGMSICRRSSRPVSRLKRQSPPCGNTAGPKASRRESKRVS